MYKFLWLMLTCSIVFANDTPQHELCLYGCPMGAAADNFFVDHQILVLSSNRSTKFADWVSYQVKVENLDGIGTLSRNWAKDPEIPAEYTFVPKDYTKASGECNYDRGHQAPLASFSNHENWRNANYLSNITPQLASLNRGAWLQLENKVRDYARESNDNLYVITGPYYTDEEMCALPKTNKEYKIPNGYWKIVATEQEGALMVVSFMLPQNIASGTGFCDYSVKLSDISKATNLQFFSEHKSTKTNSKNLYQAFCG